MRLSPAPVRSRTRGARTATGPRPVMIARSGRCPWRTSRWRPSPVCLSAWPLRKAATSASTACASSARAPSRRPSVSGSENSAGWISLTTLSWIMACHSFGGEVEVSNTPPIRRLNPSRRHQLPRIALAEQEVSLMHRAVLLAALLFIAGSCVTWAKDAPPRLAPIRAVTIEGTFYTDDGTPPARDISGIACRPPPNASAQRLCVVVNDGDRFAQLTTIQGGRLIVGATVPLIGNQPSPSTLGAKP